MASTTSAADRQIIGIDLVVADLDRAAVFYKGLGFAASQFVNPNRRALSLGGFTLGLVAAREDAHPYPPERRASDPWFQHFAIAVADMPHAFAMLETLGATPISRGGPQLLPPSTGSVTAYKFRDPDGHPLELSYIPGSDWLRNSGDAVFLGVDHTAIAVADLLASIAFYETLGFTVSGRYLNTGIEQDRLDGLDGVALDIVALSLAAGPHIELLRYRAPEPVGAMQAAEGDIAAARTIIGGPAGLPRTIRDPDGHLIVTGVSIAKGQD